MANNLLQNIKLYCKASQLKGEKWFPGEGL